MLRIYLSHCSYLYNLEKSKSIKRTNKEQSMFYHIDIFSLIHVYYSFVGHHRQQRQQQQQQHQPTT